MCPISLAPMMEPVKLRVSGKVYDLLPLDLYLLGLRASGQPLTCPETRLVVTDYGNHLEPQPELQAGIVQWCTANHHAPPEVMPIEPGFLGLLMGSDSPTVRKAAFESLKGHLLRGLSIEVIHPLFQQVYSLLDKVRSQGRAYPSHYSSAMALLVAARALSEPMPVEDIANRLLEWACVPEAVYLIDSAQPEMQALVARVLGVLQHRCPDILVSSEATTALLEVLESSQDLAVQQAAAAAIHSMRWAESEALQQDTVLALQDTARLLSSAATSDQMSAIRALQHLMTCRQCNAPHKVVAALRVLPQLVQLLSSCSPAVQQAALALISHLSSDPKMQLQLVQCGFLDTVPHLASVSGTLRTSLAKVLTHLGAPTPASDALSTAMCQALPALQALLHKCRSPVLRPVLKQLVQSLSDAQGLKQSLLTLLQRSRAEARQTAPPAAPLATQGSRKRGREPEANTADAAPGPAPPAATSRPQRSHSAAPQTAPPAAEASRKRAHEETDVADAEPAPIAASGSGRHSTFGHQAKASSLVECHATPDNLRVLQANAHAAAAAARVWEDQTQVCPGAVGATGAMHASAMHPGWAGAGAAHGMAMQAMPYMQAVPQGMGVGACWQPMYQAMQPQQAWVQVMGGAPQGLYWQPAPGHMAGTVMYPASAPATCYVMK